MIGITLIQLVQGPLVVIAGLIFIVGIVIQTLRLLRMSRPAGISSRSDRRLRLSLTPPSPWGKPSLAFRLKMVKHSVLGTHPGMIVITAAFHACILVTPLFVMAHNVLLDLAWGIRLPSFAERTADLMTILVILGGLYFLCRRIFLKRVRAITGAQDYFMLMVATAPFITGFMAYHQVLDYDLMVTLHILSAEILLITAPFTKLVHMVFFFFGRLFMVHENNLLGKGTRIWR